MLFVHHIGSNMNPFNNTIDFNQQSQTKHFACELNRNSFHKSIFQYKIHLEADSVSCRT